MTEQKPLRNEQGESPEQSNRKAEIIRALFEERWNPQTKQLSNPLVTLAELSDAIKSYNKQRSTRPLSDKNPANFFKDFIRNKRRANKNWPTTIMQSGFTARQVTGAGRCFEFVPLGEGQTEPFPLAAVPGPDESTPRINVETISLPLASRRLGRKDEPWLIQVLVRLRIIETHLALFSSRKVIQVDHLQMNVKLAQSEIDALFLAVENGNGTHQTFVTCEAKGRNDDILESQVLEQVRAAFRFPGATHVLPMAVKAFAPSQIYVVEFVSLTKEEAEHASSLKIASSAVYVLKPPIKGIGD
jgi:hypothetical protein